MFFFSSEKQYYFNWMIQVKDNPKSIYFVKKSIFRYMSGELSIFTQFTNDAFPKENRQRYNMGITKKSWKN